MTVFGDGGRDAVLARKSQKLVRGGPAIGAVVGGNSAARVDC